MRTFSKILPTFCTTLLNLLTIIFRSNQSNQTIIIYFSQKIIRRKWWFVPRICHLNLFENLESSYPPYVSIPIHPREELTRHAHARLLEAGTHARTPRENDARAFPRFYWRHAANLVSVREDERTVKKEEKEGRGGEGTRQISVLFVAYTIVQGYQPSSECMGIRENVLPRSGLTDRSKL